MPMTWSRDLLRGDRLDVAQTGPMAAPGPARCPTLPEDPIDRLLYATARDLRVPFAEEDELVHAYAAAAGDVAVMLGTGDELNGRPRIRRSP